MVTPEVLPWPADIKLRLTSPVKDRRRENPRCTDPPYPSGRLAGLLSGCAASRGLRSLPVDDGANATKTFRPV